MDKNFTIIIGAVSVIIMIVVALCFGDRLKRLKRYGYLGIFLLSLIGNISMFSPAAPLVTVIGGRYYNVWLVGFIAALGCIVGEVLSYNIGAVGEIAIKNNAWYQTIQKYMDKNGFLTILLVTAIPNPVFNFVGGIAGAIGFPLYNFLAASFLGNWLQYTLCAAFGKWTKKVM